MVIINLGQIEVKGLLGTYFGLLRYDWIGQGIDYDNDFSAYVGKTTQSVVHRFGIVAMYHWSQSIVGW